MPSTHSEHNGHRVPRRAHTDWQATAKQAADVLSRMDVPNVIRKNPMPAMAVAAGAGLILGITVGSKLVRMLVGSVGMYAVGEVAKKYAKQAMQNMDFDDDDEIEVD